MSNKRGQKAEHGVVIIEDWIDGESVLAQLKKTFSSPTYEAPRLPKVAMELLRLSQHPDVSIAQMASIMERDPVLCGDVLKIIQSPMYAGRIKITSISHVLATMGLATVRDLVLQVATTSKVFRAKAYQKTMDELRLHSTAVAYASRIVCRYTSLDAEHAFMCGLLHDVGKAGALIAIAQHMKEPPSLDDAWHAIEEVHAKASEAMTKQWSLPVEVSMVVGAHHTIRVQGHPHPLAAAVCLADHLAKEAGFGVSGGARINDHRAMPPAAAVDALALSEKQLVLIRNDVKAALDKMI